MGTYQCYVRVTGALAVPFTLLLFKAPSATISVVGRRVAYNQEPYLCDPVTGYHRIIIKKCQLSGDLRIKFKRCKGDTAKEYNYSNKYLITISGIVFYKIYVERDIT